MGDTWPLNEVYRQSPGLRWNRELSCIEGRGDAYTKLLTVSVAAGYEIFGEVPATRNALTGLARIQVPLEQGVHPAQRDGARWLCVQGSDGAILGDPMGAGKSWQSMIASRLAVGPSPKLIVCPAFLRTNWLAELERRMPGSSAKCVRSIDGFAEAVASGTEWTVVSYEGISNITSPPYYKALILDEGHYVKNATSARHKGCIELRKSIPWVAALSGTVVWNRLRDLWGISEVVRPGGLGNFLQFAKRYLLAEPGQWGWDFDGPYPTHPRYTEVTEELKARLNWYYLRRDRLTRELCGGLSTKIEPLWVDTPPNYRFPDIDSPMAMWAALRETTRYKTEVAYRLAVELLEQGNRVLIGTKQREQARDLAGRLDCPVAEGGGIDGAEMSLRMREAGCGVATMDSFGMGVNCPWVDCIIFADMDWVGPKMLQFIARGERPGRSGALIVKVIACRGTVDELVFYNNTGKLESNLHVLPDGAANNYTVSLKNDEEEVFEQLRKKLQDGLPTHS